MTKRDLKNKLRPAFEEEGLDILPRIKESCRKTAQDPLPITEPTPPPRSFVYTPAFRKMLAAAACLVLFIGGLLTGLLIPGAEDPPPVIIPAEDASVYIDVNPSLELKVDEKGTLIETVAINSDAEAVLSDLKLDGVDINTAVVAIIGSMYMNGFLGNDSDSILISIDGKEEQKETELLSSITGKINEVVEKNSLECNVLGQVIDAREELKSVAAVHGVSAGKMHLVMDTVADSDDYTEADLGNLAELPIKDLHLVYTETRKDGDKGSITVGKDEVIKDREEAFGSLVAMLQLAGDLIEHYEIKTVTEMVEGKNRAVYRVTIRLAGDDTEYVYILDVSTGELLLNKTQPAEPGPGEDENQSEGDEPSGGDDPAEGGGSGDDDDGRGHHPGPWWPFK